MQTAMCSRCGKNIAVIFITKIDGNNTTKNEGLCLKCARELHIKPVDDILTRMGISDEDLDSLSGEMMNALHRTEFEGQRFLITDRHDSMLRRLYGDYMTLPPASEQVCKHQPARIAFHGETEFTLTAGGNTDIR